MQFVTVYIVLQELSYRDTGCNVFGPASFIQGHSDLPVFISIADGYEISNNLSIILINGNP